MARLTIRSEIAGRVWKADAGPGARLDAGDPVVVLESMKMEVPVPAPAAGRVVALFVTEGDAVSEGQEIAVVET